MDQAQRPVRLDLHHSLLARVPAQADLNPGDAVALVVIEQGQLLHVGNAEVWRALPSDMFHFTRLGEDRVSLTGFEVADKDVAGRHKVPWVDGSGDVPIGATWLSVDGYRGFLMVSLSDIRLLSVVQELAPDQDVGSSPSASPAAKKQATAATGVGVGPRAVSQPKLPARHTGVRKDKGIAKFFAPQHGERASMRDAVVLCACAICRTSFWLYVVQGLQELMVLNRKRLILYPNRHLRPVQHHLPPAQPGTL